MVYFISANTLDMSYMSQVASSMLSGNGQQSPERDTEVAFCLIYRTKMPKAHFPFNSFFL